MKEKAGDLEVDGEKNTEWGKRGSKGVKNRVEFYFREREKWKKELDLGGTHQGGF